MIGKTCMILGSLALGLWSSSGAFAQLQTAARDAKAQLDVVVTGDRAEVDQAFINNALARIDDVLENLPDRVESAPASPTQSLERKCVCVRRGVPKYGCLGRFHGYRYVTTWEYHWIRPKQYKSASSQTIRRAILEELTEIRGTLNVTDPAQVDQVIELSKQALGLITFIQRRNLQ